MSLNSGQRRHLVSVYATVSHLLRQMEEAAAEGRSPTGVGPPLSSLPSAEIEAVCRPLRELQRRLREFAVLAAPDELAAFEHPQSLHNTRVWISNLLEKMRAAVESLQPRPMRKYGGVAEGEAERLAALTASLLQGIHEARRHVDASL